MTITIDIMGEPTKFGMLYRFQGVSNFCALYYREEAAKISFSKVLSWRYSYHPIEHWLKLHFDGEATQDDLDQLIAILTTGLGLRTVMKNRQKIMKEILTAAKAVSQETVMHLLDAMDSYPSLMTCLDNGNYPLARLRVDKAFAEGAVTESERELVLATIPVGFFEPVD